MKLLNYQLQTHIESLSGAKSTQFFGDYIRTILQDTTKPYYQELITWVYRFKRLKQK